MLIIDVFIKNEETYAKSKLSRCVVYNIEY